MMPHPQTRTRTRTRTRRFSACNRHPSEPVTGFCALCLRDRLAGLDSCSSKVDSENENAVVCSRRTRRSNVVVAPRLQRSKSVAAEGKRERVDDNNNNNNVDINPRRNSCDVRVRNTLSDLFVVDNTKKHGVKSSDLVSFLGDEVRVSDDAIMENEIDSDHDDDDGDETEDDEEEGDLKTMKEIIEMEFENKKRNFWDAASVFSQKLRKWRQKQKEKKQSRSKLGQLSQFRDSRTEVEDNRFSGRRSCDTEPRFSIDGHRLSVEDPRISFDEHRASWDGYMIARTIPRLTPMLSVVDNMMLGPGNRGKSGTTTVENLQMHSISEDGGSSGGSGQSVSDSSVSNKGSSSGWSVKTLGSGGGGEDVKSVSNARVSPANDVVFQGTKLVITEKELNDWHLNSVKNNNIESVSTGKTAVATQSDSRKTLMSSRWKKVCNLWGHKHKVDDKNGDKKHDEDVLKHKVETGISSVNLVRNQSLVKLRNRNTRYSTSDLDSGLLRLYLTPFRNSRRNKAGKSRIPPSMVCN